MLIKLTWKYVPESRKYLHFVIEFLIINTFAIDRSSIKRSLFVKYNIKNRQSSQLPHLVINPLPVLFMKKIK